MKVRAHDPFDELMEPLDTLEQRMRAASAEMLETIGRLDHGWVDDPSVPDLACEIAARHRITSRLTAERLRVARAVRSLPSLLRAHAEGRISWDQLRWLTRIATPETDAEWAERGTEMTPNALRLESRRQERVSRRQAERDHAMRTLRMDWDEEHRFLYLDGCLDAEDGAAVEAALDRAAQRITVDEDASDRRGALLADALVGLLTSSGSRRQTPTLVIHADTETLAGVRNGRRHLSETSSGAQLSDEAVQRIACGARLKLALHKEGRLTGLASAARFVSEGLMRMLLFRDRSCRFPGCERTWYLLAHHIVPWPRGGTEMGNLVVLCGTHHRKVHEGGWTIRGRPPDQLEFIDRSGRVLGRPGRVMTRTG